MRLSHTSILTVSVATLVVSKPIFIAHNEERQVLTTSTIFGITQTSTGLTIIPTEIDPACIINATITSRDTCGDLAARYRIMLSADDKSYPAGSDVCQDIMAGFRICTLLSAGSTNATSTRGVSQTVTLSPHNTTRAGSSSSATTSPFVTSSTGDTSTAAILTSTSSLTYTPTTFLLDTTTGLGYGFSTITAVRTTTITTVVPSETLTDVEPTYYTTRVYTYTTTITRPTLPASAHDTSSGLTNVTITHSSSSIRLTTTLGTNRSSCKGVAAPGPTQEGINPNCNKWYVVEEGDSCSSIAEKNGIDEDDFDDWNPYVGGPDCDTLFAGDAVCVGVCGGTGPLKSSTSTSFRTVTSSYPLPVTGSGSRALTNISTTVSASHSILTASRSTSPSLTRGTSISSRTTSHVSTSSDPCNTRPTSMGSSSSSVSATSSTSHSSTSTSSTLISTTSHSSTSSSITSISSTSHSSTSVSSTSHSSTLTSSTSHSSTLTSSTSHSSTLTSSTSISSTSTSSRSSQTSLTSTSVASSRTSAVTSSTSSAASTTATSTGVAYKLYTGDGSTAAGWPAESQWVDFDDLFENNTPHMTAECAAYNAPLNTDAENADIKTAILSISTLTGVDTRFILAIIMQESWGCVRVPSTTGSVTNPGLMQSHDGRGTCNNGTVVQTPCPYSKIYQMVLDGTNGTYTDPLTTGDGGDGLTQTLASQEASGYSGAQAYYRAARMYNSGSVTSSDLGSGVGTACYVSDIANRLTGWYGWVSNCTAATAG